MLDIKYHIIIGRKGRMTELNLLFEPAEFHHLAGLHKLHDLRLARGNRAKVFSQILAGSISAEDLKKSKYFSIIQKTPEASLPNRKPIGQQQAYFFGITHRFSHFSLIEAEYLLSTPTRVLTSTFFLINVPNPIAFSAALSFPKKKKTIQKGRPFTQC